MKSCFSQSAQRALLSLGVVLLGLPAQSLFADQMVHPSALTQTHYYYPDNNDCCQNPCEDKGCCYSNAAVLVGAVVVGGVAGALVGRSTKHRHSSGSGNGRKCSGNVDIDHDVGQTLAVVADIEITGLLGTTTFTIFGKSQDNVIVQGDSVTFTNSVPSGMGPFIPIHLTLPTFQDPVIGTFNFWIDVTISGGGDDIVETTVATFRITPSRLNSAVEIFTPEPVILPVAISPPTPFSSYVNTQLGVEYNYLAR